MSTYVQPNLNDSVGSLMIGAFLNGMLYAHEVTLVFRFFRDRTRSDSWYIRLGLALLFLNDTVGTGAEIACVYLYTITHWGNTAYVQNQNVTIPLYLFTSGISAIICQLYLVERVYKLSKSWIYPPVLLAAGLAGFAGAVWTGYTILVHSTYSERNSIVVPVTVWLIASAVTDVLIAGLLLVFLYRAKRIAVRFEATRLEAPLQRMMINTVESGSVTTVIALAALIDFLHDDESNVCTGIAFLLGRVYALTCLFSLNQKGQKFSNGNSSTSHDGKRTRFDHTGQLVSGVQVHHTATVVVERADAHELDLFDDRYGTKATKANSSVSPKLYMVHEADDEKVSWRKDRLDSV